MGYTHYWVQSRSFTPEEWEAIRTATNAVIASQTGRETLGDDALANDDEIHLNGIGDDQHEPFHITRQLVPLSPQQQSMRDTIKKKTRTPWTPLRSNSNACTVAALTKPRTPTTSARQRGSRTTLLSRLC